MVHSLENLHSQLAIHMHGLIVKRYFKQVQSEKIRTFRQVLVIVIFLGQFYQRGKGAMRLTLCKPPTHETRPDHNTGNYVPYSFR